MNITRKEVLHVAELAHLELDDEIADRMCIQIGDVLGYVAQLNRVETQNVPPTAHVLSLTNAFREDEKAGHLEQEEVFSNAPETDEGAFNVPRVIRE